MPVNYCSISHVLRSTREVVRYDFSPYVTRYPVTAAIYEQETNQGSFVNKEGELCGLKYKMTADDIRKIGHQDLGAYIAEKNPLVIAARECCLTDFRGLYCSNDLTKFETRPISSAVECAEELEE